MKQKKGLQLRLLLFLGLVIVFSSKVIYATNPVSELEEEKESIRSNLEVSQEEIGQLEEKKEGLEAYLDNLNTELTEISDHLTKLGRAVSHKVTQIEKTNKNLDYIKAQEEVQYKDMKKRIQFMYEKESISYFEIVFTSANFADMLNRASFIKEISSYDRDMLKKYQNTKDLIEEQEKQLLQEQEELGQLQAKTELEQNALAEIMQKTAEEISFYGDEIFLVEAKTAKFEEEIRGKEEAIEEKKKEQERIIEEQAKSAQIGSYSAINATDTDLGLLSAIIECEAEGESYEGQIAVGAVVLNRLRSGLFPNTIIGVIYQSGQFSPVASGRFAAVLARGANASCTSAAIDSLAGANTIGSALFFKRNDNTTQGQVLGNHVFY